MPRTPSRPIKLTEEFCEEVEWVTHGVMKLASATQCVFPLHHVTGNELKDNVSDSYGIAVERKFIKMI